LGNLAVAEEEMPNVGGNSTAGVDLSKLEMPLAMGYQNELGV